MSRQRQCLVGVLGVVMIGAAIGEHVSRLTMERRYRQALAGRQQLERDVASTLLAHERLTRERQEAQRRAQALSEDLTSTRRQLEEAVGRLSQERQNVRELHTRVAALQQQLDQLQGELAMSLEQRQASVKAGEPAPVELERIVVSDTEANHWQGRILSVHQDWNFVIIDLGWNAVRVGDTVSIFRNDSLLAKARIERVQEGVCAATLLPEWNQAEVHPNDLVRIL